MERWRFGPTGRDVAVIGQGTWELDKGDRRAAVAALRAGPRPRHDAHRHRRDVRRRRGRSSAEAIAGRRDEVFLVSKVLPENATRKGTLRPASGRSRRLADRSAGLLSAALARRASARGHDRRLRGAAARRARSCSWGVSNFDVADLEEARAIAGAGRIACNQVLYHLRGARHRARRASLVRGARRRRRRVQRRSAQRRFPGPRTAGRPGARTRSPPRTAPRRARSRCGSSCGGRRSSRFRRRRSPEHVAENAAAGTSS